ncbi:MAG TPA: HdeD family acid-resistance protein [Blastocatellia bacterium]|jgi:uncharacterized membrane protein HdeD (DUF308 family)|nr:HdeD family acid-resistance protein [Blastocatellia bacterium]
MLHALARNWWVLLLNGLCAIAFGVMAFARPGLTLWALLFLFGTYALCDGVTAVLAALFGRDETGRPWWRLLFAGIVSILVGMIAITRPDTTAVALLTLIAVWAIIRGALEIAAAIMLRKLIDKEWLLGLAGAASILFGLVLVARPGQGALTMIWLIGLFAIVHGALRVGLAFRVRKFKQTLEAVRTAATGGA